MERTKGKPSLPLGEAVHGVRREQDGAGRRQIHEQGHVTSRMAGRLQQPDRSISEEVQVVLQASPLKARTLQVRADVPLSLRRICGMGGVELTAVHYDRRSRKM